jgi:cell shape-determining protein MreC
VVPIFTHRDDRKLFAVIGAVVVAALIAFVQIDSVRNGRANPFSALVTSVAGAVQSGLAATFDAAGGVVSSIGDLPRLHERNERLTAENRALTAENAGLREALSRMPDLEGLARASAAIRARSARARSATIPKSIAFGDARSRHVGGRPRG